MMLVRNHASFQFESLLIAVTAGLLLCMLSSVPGQCVDLVQDCGGKADSHTDNAQAFAVCQHLASQRSGCITVPAGLFRLSGVMLNVSNIEIRINNDAVLLPVQTNTSVNIFTLGSRKPVSTDYLQNISVLGEAPGQFTIDISYAQCDPWKTYGFAFHGGVKGFVVANMLCKMSNPVVNPLTPSYADAACIGVNYANFSGTRLNPQDGVLENLTCTGCVFGYGLMQIRSGEKISVRNILSEGGVTLRLETGDGPYGYVGDIIGENITCKNGRVAVMSGPHIQLNGVYHLNNVTSIGCYGVLDIGAGFSQYGFPQGYFSNFSTISNVVAIYGTQGQNASDCKPVPSCWLCAYRDVPYRYNVTLTNLTTVGFPAPSDRTVCAVRDLRRHGCQYGT